MKMYNLAEKPYSMPVVSKRRKKPEPYYPEVTIEGAKELNAKALGKKITFHGTGEIKSHTIDQTAEGEKIRTRICLKEIGVTGAGTSNGKGYVCPECGKGGGKGYCPQCGARRMKRGK